MGQFLHGSAKTTHAIRAELQRSKAPTAALARRSFALRNARRTDLLVGLLGLHLDGRDDPAVYRRILQEYAEANGGGAPNAQRAGHDRYDPATHRAIPSLRAHR